MNKLNFLSLEHDSNIRILPKTGDVVIVKFLQNVLGKRGFFELQFTVGRCLYIKKKGICCSFLLRNVIHKNIIEQSFYIYSPCLISLRVFKGFYGNYRKPSKLYFLRSKKLSVSKFNLNTVMGLSK